MSWFDTERISTGQISAPSTFGVSRWNKAIGINLGKVVGWAEGHLEFSRWHKASYTYA